MSDVTVSDLVSLLAPSLEEDLLLALRLAYYVHSRPLVPDAHYDQAEREFIDRPEIEDSPLMQPGSDKLADYPDRIRALYLYLGLIRAEKRPINAPETALDAKPSPVSPPAKGKAAKKDNEAATGSLF